MNERNIKLTDFEKPGKDITCSIAEAIEYAIKNEIDTIIFEPKSYLLETYKNIKTHSIAHDDGCGIVDSKDCHIILKDIKNLTLRGQVNKEGEILTVLKGFNPQISQTRLPSIIWAENCTNLKIENIAFTRFPECAGAGVVDSVNGSLVTVKTFDGTSCFEGMGAYCMNKLDSETRSLNTESITYGFGIDDRWHRVQPNIFSIENEHIASSVKASDGLSWHQSGLTDFQMFFGNCNDLSFVNVRVINTNSFAILTENCKNIYANGLVIKPDSHQFFTGPRDGWKIYRCSGTILLDNCHIEGVRMDGQNVHSNFMVFRERLSDNCAVFSCKYAPITMENNTLFRIYNENETQLLKITDWSIIGNYQEEALDENLEGAAKAVVGTINNNTLYKLVFKEAIPNYVHKGTLGTPLSWEPEAYQCRNTTFLNIAGAGQLLRCGNTIIENCTYKNIMNAGILLGAELSTHCEGGHAINVRINKCVFDNCGFKARYGKRGKGCISIKSQGFDNTANKNITIENNKFLSSLRAVEICNAENVILKNNLYYNIEEEVMIDKASTHNINILD